ncbi:hypothetical protein, partial [uncultured Gammaproteobacteria bacterium]
MPVNWKLCTYESNSSYFLKVFYKLVIRELTSRL